MTRANAIGCAIPWVILGIVFACSNWQISEVLRTRKIMMENNSARIAMLEKRIMHLEASLVLANEGDSL